MHVIETVCYNKCFILSFSCLSLGKNVTEILMPFWARKDGCADNFLLYGIDLLFKVPCFVSELKINLSKEIFYVLSN